MATLLNYEEHLGVLVHKHVGDAPRTPFIFPSFSLSCFDLIEKYFEKLVH